MAAHSVGEYALTLTKSETSSWSFIVKDGHFQSLASYNPIPLPAAAPLIRPSTTRGISVDDDQGTRDTDRVATHRIVNPENEQVRVIVSKEKRATQAAVSAPLAGKRG